MSQAKRVVIGVGPDKKSAAIHRDSPNHQEVPGIFWRSTLWAATELPVNNQAVGDRGADVTIREPTENGLIFRALEIPPDIKDAKKHIEILQELNKKVKQRASPQHASYRYVRYVHGRVRRDLPRERHRRNPASTW